MSRCHHTERDLGALQAATLLCSAAWAALFRTEQVVPLVRGRTFAARISLFEKWSGKAVREVVSVLYPFVTYSPDVAAKNREWGMHAGQCSARHSSLAGCL
ncbi:hypothetical protein GGR55DRAFT_646034 [Xylaria sp. FL0064]|nr:hypothetical protein GGR55DRAFT_646034 [Xylaria sp. FL0064]